MLLMLRKSMLKLNNPKRSEREIIINLQVELLSNLSLSTYIENQLIPPLLVSLCSSNKDTSFLRSKRSVGACIFHLYMKFIGHDVESLSNFDPFIQTSREYSWTRSNSCKKTTPRHKPSLYENSAFALTFLKKPEFHWSDGIDSSASFRQKRNHHSCYRILRNYEAFNTAPSSGTRETCLSVLYVILDAKSDVTKQGVCS